MDVLLCTPQVIPAKGVSKNSYGELFVWWYCCSIACRYFLRKGLRIVFYGCARPVVDSISAFHQSV